MTDPSDVAYNLIHDAKLRSRLTELSNNIAVAQIEAQQNCRGLQKVGSHRISAPAILNGDLRAGLQALHDFTKTALEQIAQVQDT